MRLGRFLSILISLSCFSQISYAKMIKTSDISVIRQEVLKLTKDDLVTFDVKGVIFSPTDQILSHEFISYYKEFIKEIERTKGTDEAKRLDGIVLLNYEPKLVDPGIPQVIKAIQHKEIKVIALTGGFTGSIPGIESREDLRVKTLKSFDIDFSPSFLVPLIKFDSLLQKDDKSEAPPLYKNGILFTSRHSKGLVLKSFLEKVKFKPKTLIHIDNNAKKIDDVGKFAQGAGINYLGIHYNKIDEKYPQEFDKSLADKKFEILVKENVWISDQVARCMIDTGASIKKCNLKKFVKQ